MNWKIIKKQDNTQQSNLPNAKDLTEQRNTIFNDQNNAGQHHPNQV
jgi:hypothetical protein